MGAGTEAAGTDDVASKDSPSSAASKSDPVSTEEENRSPEESAPESKDLDSGDMTSAVTKTADDQNGFVSRVRDLFDAASTASKDGCVTGAEAEQILQKLGTTSIPGMPVVSSVFGRFPFFCNTIVVF